MLGQSTAPFCIVLTCWCNKVAWTDGIMLRAHILTSRNNCVLRTYFKIHKQFWYRRLLQQNSLWSNQLEVVRYATNKALEVPPNSMYIISATVIKFVSYRKVLCSETCRRQKNAFHVKINISVPNWLCLPNFCKWGRFLWHLTWKLLHGECHVKL
jgi:hypothetical protein